MNHRIAYFLFVIASFVACKTSRTMHTKPQWVQQRPTNDLYYVGIGIASKASNPFDFQQVAKKNAVNDLVSEIKVTVSSNSALMQFQNNKEFSQQFESDIKVTALNTIEHFTVVDSWEDKEYFWIYYRLSKDEYKETQRKRMMAALEQAENYYSRALQMDKDQFMQSIRLKIKALSALQFYLNQDLQTVIDGKQVYMVSELINSIQNQLYEVELKSKTHLPNGIVGKPLKEPFEVKARYRLGNEPVPYLPLYLQLDNGRIEGTQLTETDQTGVASLTISRIVEKSPVQNIRVLVNIHSIIKTDSLSQTLQNMLFSLDAPSTTIRLNVIPIKVFMQSEEQNLGKPLQASYLDAALKKQMIDDGATFVDAKEQADYVMKIVANTVPQGAIWGNMRTATLNLTLSVIDNTNRVEIYKDGLRDIKGFQTTDENAGIDAYRTATQQVLKNLYPSLKRELMRNN
jgi:hypothetical protein